jgi:hypothetical protein
MTTMLAMKSLCMADPPWGFLSPRIPNWHSGYDVTLP